jgi:serine/threonine protein phosphatase PrpC
MAQVIPSPITPNVASFTLKGEKIYNEDSSLSVTLTPTVPLNTLHPSTPAWLSVALVADGHGQNGEGLECATFCKSQVYQWAQHLLDSDMNWEAVPWEEYATALTAQLHNDYRTICSQKTNSRIITQGIVLIALGCDAVHSGTTLSIALLFPTVTGFRLVTIQVGDSDIAVNGSIIECDHTPLNPAEFARVQVLEPERRFNIVYDSPAKQNVFLADGTFDPVFYDGTKAGHARWNWARGLKPCCAKYIPGSYAVSHPNFPYKTCISMTRSIGDFYGHVIGLTTQPDVHIMDFNSIPTVVIASDGVWDTCDVANKWIRPDKSVIFQLDVPVEQEQTLVDAVNTYCIQLHQYSATLFGKNCVDDISIAVIKP